MHGSFGLWLEVSAKLIGSLVADGAPLAPSETHYGSIADWAMVIVSVGLAYFTYQLWAATKDLAENTLAESKRQAAQTAEALELARREFAATNFPRLAIRRFAYFDDRDDDHPSGFIVCTISNYGGSPAVITESRIQHQHIQTEDDLQVRAGYGDVEVLTPGTTIAAGAYLDILVKDWSLLVNVSKWLNNLFVQSSSHAFFGYIDFVDSQGVSRRLAFGQKLDSAGKRFEGLTDPDFVYQDYA